MNLKTNGKVFTSKSVGTGPSSCEERIHQAAVSKRLRNTVLQNVSRTLIRKHDIVQGSVDGLLGEILRHYGSPVLFLFYYILRCCALPNKNNPQPYSQGMYHITFPKTLYVRSSPISFLVLRTLCNACVL